MKDLTVILFFIAAFLVVKFVINIAWALIFKIGVPLIITYFLMRHFKLI